MIIKICLIKTWIIYFLMIHFSNMTFIIVIIKYYFEIKESYFEILSVIHVQIKSKSGRMIFHPANLEAIKCITEILTEIDLIINQFSSHFAEIKDKIKYLSAEEIYSLSL